MARSINSTLGGLDYDDLLGQQELTDVQNYTWNLCDIRQATTNRNIQHFIIGKTYTDGRRGRDPPNPSDHEDWLSEGIGHRFRHYEGERYHGVVGIIILTRNHADRAHRTTRIITGQEEFALQLETELINYYRTERNDRRLQNGNVAAGRRHGNGHTGAVIYIAYRLAPL